MSVRPDGDPPPRSADAGSSLVRRVIEIAVLLAIAAAVVVIWLRLTGGDDGGSGLEADQLEALLMTEAEVNADVPAASAHYRPVTDGSEAVTPVFDFSRIEDPHRFAECQEIRRHILPGGSGTSTRVAFRNEESGALVIHTLGLVGEGAMSVEDFDGSGGCSSLFTMRQGVVTVEGLEEACNTEADGLGDQAASFGLDLYATDVEGQTDTGTEVLCGIMVQRRDVVSTVIVTAGRDAEPRADMLQDLAEAIDDRLRSAVDD